LTFNQVLLLFVATAIVVAIVLTSNLEKVWLANLIKTQGLGMLSIIISTAALGTTFVYDFWKPEDLVVYFRFSNPIEIGTNQLHLNYIVSNSGKSPAFVEEVSLVQIHYSKITNDQLPLDFDICNGDALLPYTYTLDRADLKSTWKDKLGRYTRFYAPSKTYVDGIESVFSSLHIDAGSQRVISTLYDTDPLDWSNSNVLLLCPIVRFFDSSGRPFIAMCRGFQVDNVHFDSAAAQGRRFGQAPGPARLLPKADSTCRILPIPELKPASP
jgi:hypothetical protein